MTLKLVVANKAYSSWSLRPWILLAHFKIPFEEVVIPMDRPETRAAMLKYAPTGKCPSLHDGGIAVWESLAIIDYVAETFPEKAIWPRGKAARAHARSLAAEMHAGFTALRQALPDQLPSQAEGDRAQRRSPRRRGADRGGMGACARDIRQGGPVPVRTFLRRRRDVRAGRQPLPRLRRPGQEGDARLYGRDDGAAGMEGLDRRRRGRAVADRKIRSDRERARFERGRGKRRRAARTPEPRARGCAGSAAGGSLPRASRAISGRIVYHNAMTASWPAFVAALAAAFVALNFLFALALRSRRRADRQCARGLADLFFFSVETTSTVGYGDMHPQTTYGHLVATAESFIGILLLAMMTGLVFARISRPRARLIFARYAVVAAHDGVPTLMFRMANARSNFITEAMAKAWMIGPTVSQEGQAVRRIPADAADQVGEPDAGAELDPVPSDRRRQSAVRHERRGVGWRARSISSSASSASTRRPARLFMRATFSPLRTSASGTSTRTSSGSTTTDCGTSITPRSIRPGRRRRKSESRDPLRFRWVKLSNWQ